MPYFPSYIIKFILDVSPTIVRFASIMSPTEEAPYNYG